ncbi:MAG: acetyl-CoA C-acetyltransferase [Chloroflexi bacterium]|nr:acetyl-CoA C-acetyltransferase [Chloroflexota bacterium]
MREVVLAGAARTPMGKLSGALASVTAPQLGSIAIAAAIRRAGISPDQVEYTIMGNVLSTGVGQAPARQAAIGAGIPSSSSALTVNKVCASGLMAAVLAAQMVQLDEAEIVVAGGMESMTQAPHYLAGSRIGLRLGDGRLVDSMIRDGLWCAFADRHMGASADAIARKYGITRQEQDEFAYGSHRKAVAASAEGAFRDEIAPVSLRQRRGSTEVGIDEGPRPDTSLEALAKLPPAFGKDGTVTAGNSSQLTDGAAAFVVMSSQKAQELGVPILAYITGYAHSALDPEWIFDAPSLATRQLLKKTGARLEDYDLVEANEAFAAQVLANGKVLGWDWGRVNVKGGATALGHPIGASGARILVTLLYALRQRQQKKGLAVICHGGGGAVALSVETP